MTENFGMSLEKLNKYLTGTQLDINASMIEKARQVAVQAHAGQTRWNGDDYVTHPIRVAQSLALPFHQTIALLHDVVEDSVLTLDDLRVLGFPDNVVLAVDHVTKRDGETYLEFILRAKQHDAACAVKIADIEDNLRDLSSINKRFDKYQLALWILES